ncbi:hypothetical protein HDU84_001817 [Entophlyctis sp. JEL0112]|nr:hypothetical protein HDU84_001817 [Entophlyctis sp. JEL0112]
MSLLAPLPPAQTVHALALANYLALHRTSASNAVARNSDASRRLQPLYARALRVYASRSPLFQSTHILRSALLEIVISSEELLDMNSMYSMLSILSVLEARRRLLIRDAKSLLEACPAKREASTKAAARLRSLLTVSAERLQRRYETAVVNVRRWVLALKIVTQSADSAQLQVLLNRLFTNPAHSAQAELIGTIANAEEVGFNSRESIAVKLVDLVRIKRECLSWISAATIAPSFAQPLEFMRTECPWNTVAVGITTYVYNDFDFSRDVDGCVGILEREEVAAANAGKKRGGGIVDVDDGEDAGAVVSRKRARAA